MRAVLLSGVAALAFGLILVPEKAAAAYVSGGAGLVGVTDDSFLGSGAAVQAAAGWDSGFLRYEIEAQWTGQDFEESVTFAGNTVTGGVELDIYTGTLGAYFELPVPIFTPYIGGGAGIGYADFTGTGVLDGFSTDDTFFVAHGEVGLDVSVAPLISVGPALRYTYYDTEAGEEFYTGRIVLRVGF